MVAVMENEARLEDENYSEFFVVELRRIGFVVKFTGLARQPYL